MSQVLWLDLMTEKQTGPRNATVPLDVLLDVRHSVASLTLLNPAIILVRVGFQHLDPAPAFRGPGKDTRPR